MNLDELRRFILAHREDETAFQVYVDRSKSAERTITINPADPEWEAKLERRIQQATSDESASN